MDSDAAMKLGLAPPAGILLYLNQWNIKKKYCQRNMYTDSQ